MSTAIDMLAAPYESARELLALPDADRTTKLLLNGQEADRLAAVDAAREWKEKYEAADAKRAELQRIVHLTVPALVELEDRINMLRNLVMGL